MDEHERRNHLYQGLYHLTGEGYEVYGLETTTISADLNLVITIGVVLLQFYIALKLAPIKKDVEYLKGESEKQEKEIKALYDRCYENHKEHQKK